MMGCGLRRHPSVRGNVSDEDTAVFFSVPPSVTPPHLRDGHTGRFQSLVREGQGAEAGGRRSLGAGAGQGPRLGRKIIDS